MTPSQRDIVKFTQREGRGLLTDIFFTDTGSAEFADCAALADAGFMKNLGSPSWSPDTAFQVTDAGRAAISQTPEGMSQ